MGRVHPYYCKHGKMLDGGDFYYEDEVDTCEACHSPAIEMLRRAFQEAEPTDDHAPLIVYKGVIYGEGYPPPPPHVVAELKELLNE